MTEEDKITAKELSEKTAAIIRMFSEDGAVAAHKLLAVLSTLSGSVIGLSDDPEDIMRSFTKTMKEVCKRAQIQKILTPQEFMSYDTKVEAQADNARQRNKLS